MTNFCQLQPGDVFQIVGLMDSGDFRKSSADRAFGLADGTWVEMPNQWPVVVVDRIMEL